MMYRCETISEAGFIQQVAVSYIANGYFFYVAGAIPPGKDPVLVDQKIIERYEIGISKWTKARRKHLGQANLQYIRFERFFLILATHGNHRFFEEEASVIRDVRRIPIRFAGYSLSFRAGHASVRIDPREYQTVKAYFLEHAVRRHADWLAIEFAKLRFQPYAPIRRQLACIHRAINRQRRTAGMPDVPRACLLTKRKVCRPFGAPEHAQSLAMGATELSVDFANNKG